MKLNLNKPKKVTIRPAIDAVEVTIDEIEVIVISDNGKSVFAHVVINGTTNKKLTLWEDDDYNTIGDWTQKQANAKIEELL